MSLLMSYCCLFFFFNDTATTEIYTLSLHDALPISRPPGHGRAAAGARRRRGVRGTGAAAGRALGAGASGGRGLVDHGADRKSTRLNSSHANISYAVFCLKKKNM